MSIRAPWHELVRRANQGATPYVLATVYAAIASNLVYTNPRSLPAFLLFLGTLGLVYFLNMTGRAKAMFAAVLLLVVMPIVGIRNIFYLEVGFQVAVYSALALGLNIVVGMAGLLDLGYVAFYAVGAYLWGIFGSRQLFVLNEVPGTAPATTAFPLDANFFWLFLILAFGLAALVGASTASGRWHSKCSHR